MMMNLQLPSTLQSFIVRFSSLFICATHNFTVLVLSQRSHTVIFREYTVKSRQTQLESSW